MGYRFPSIVAAVCLALSLGFAAPAWSQADEQTVDKPDKSGQRLNDANKKGEFKRFAGSAAAPPLRVDTDALALGYVRPQQTVTRTILLHNMGEERIEITRTTASCACTALKPEEKFIEPGGSVEFTVQYDASQNIGPINKDVRVFCDGFSRPFTTKVTGEVTYGVQLNKNGLRGILQRAGLITLDSIDGEPFNVISINGDTPDFAGFDPAEDEPRNSYIIQYNWVDRAVEDLPRWVVVETDHPEGRMMDLRVIIPDVQTNNILVRSSHKFRPMEDRILIPELATGQPETFTLELKGIGKASADTVVFSTDSEDVSVELVGREADPKGNTITYTLRASAAPTASGFVSAVIDVTAGDRTTAFDFFTRVVTTAVGHSE